MKATVKGRHVVCCGLMVLGAAAVSAQTKSVNEVNGGVTNVRAACTAEAGNLTGASLDKFMTACLIEKTSPEEKVSSCEQRMIDAISKRAQRDPEQRRQFIESCVRAWNPSKK